ncbi:MAG: hypothetical protein ACYC63_18400 [Armatimonadota bacterium]
MKIMKKPWIDPVVVEIDLSATHPDIVEHMFQAVVDPPAHGEALTHEAALSPDLIELHRKAILALIQAIEAARTP